MDIMHEMHILCKDFNRVRRDKNRNNNTNEGGMVLHSGFRAQNLQLYRNLQIEIQKKIRRIK